MTPHCARCHQLFSPKQAKSRRRYCVRCGIELHHERMRARAVAERAERQPAERKSRPAEPVDAGEFWRFLADAEREFGGIR